MISAFVITLRETLEAALIIGLIFGYLKKTKQTEFSKFVWAGVGLGVISSLIGALAFNSFYGGFEGAAEELFDGATMLLGAALLTTFLIWLHKNRSLTHMHSKVHENFLNAGGIGLMVLALISILREGIEIVLFLAAMQSYDLWSAALGIMTAAVTGYLIFVEAIRLNVKKFFMVTNIFLVLFAAGMVAHGIHELQEAGAIPVFIEHVWDINPTPVGDNYHPLHEEGLIGGFLAGIFGYNGNPSLLEVMGYFAYLGGALLVWKGEKLFLQRFLTH